MLRQEIQKIVLRRNGCTAKILEVLEADKKLCTLFQGHNESLDSSLRAHVEKCEAIRHPGYNLPAARIIADEQGLDFDSLTNKDKKQEFMDVAAKRYLAALFFSGLNKDKYKQLKKMPITITSWTDRRCQRLTKRSLDGGGVPPGLGGGNAQGGAGRGDASDGKNGGQVG